MKKVVIYIFIVILGLFGCQKIQPSDGHNAKNSLDWAGQYSGTLPAADCPGIETTITLNNDLTFIKSYRFIDRELTPNIETGKFKWRPDGTRIVLKTKYYKENYFVAERKIIMLDQTGNRITGNIAPHFELNKKY